MIWLIRLASVALTALVLTAPVEAQTLEQMAGQMIIVGFQGDERFVKELE